jgi:Flp pilus assembly protein TadD
MYCNSRRISAAILLLVSVLTYKASIHAQNSVSSGAPHPAVTILDSTKEQDGLVGSVRRVRIESAKLEVKEGRPVEGPLQLLEITTYGVKGNRIDNVSYPVVGSLVGKEEYTYDSKGNIIEMTLRDNSGAILGREAYDYEFDKLGNWTKMVTNLVVFESGEVKREPVEVTHRTLTYYFDDSIAKIVSPSSSEKPPALPSPTRFSRAKLRRIEKELNHLTRRYVSESSLSSESSPALVGDLSPEITKNTVQPRLTESSSASATATTPAVDTAPEEVISNNRTSLIDTSAQKLALNYHKTGRQLFEAGDSKAAVEAYLRSIELEPKSADVQLSLGQAYLKLQKDKEAVKALEESVRLNPKSPEAQYGLGLAYFRKGRNKEAGDAFTKAIILLPNMAKAHYGLGKVYQELGEQDAVLGEYNLLKTLDSRLAKQLVETFSGFSFPCHAAPFCK